jgi:CDP-diacylglycerol--glycerol-3-phosphate 3-phosphatidyltransferase
MQVEPSTEESRRTLTESLRVFFKWFLDPVAGFLNRLGLYPNTLTLSGLIGTAVGSFFVARGNFLVGGLILLAIGPVDALDGAMARLRGEASDFGAFVDSVTDRYSDLIIIGGLLAYYLIEGNSLLAGLAFVTAAGSVMVSYTRARAESLGFEAKVGIMTRLERYVVLIPSIVLGYPQIGLAIVALLANITALHRILYVRSQARRR